MSWFRIPQPPPWWFPTPPPASPASPPPPPPWENYYERLQRLNEDYNRILELRPPIAVEFEKTVVDRIARRLPLAPEVLRPFIRELIKDFDTLKKVDYPSDPESVPENEFRRIEYHAHVRRWFGEDPETFTGEFTDVCVRILEQVVAHLPAQQTSPLKTTLGLQISAPRKFAHAVYQITHDKFRHVHVLHNRMMHNLMQARVDIRGAPMYLPFDDSVDEADILHLYFHDTVLWPLLQLPVAVPFSLEKRFEHTHIVGSTGAGKSTLLKNLIAHDLREGNCVIVIDPHKSLVDDLQISVHGCFIDPEDPPGINIFEAPPGEQAFFAVTKMLSYFFREGDTPPTGKQNMVFQYLCRLMLVFPQTRGRNATLMDLFEYLSDPAPFANDVQALGSLAKSFFKDFEAKGSEYKDTAAQLRYRMHMILSNPVMEKMFSSEKTTFNFSSEIKDQNLILIDCHDVKLGEFHSLFGRIFLARILEAVKARGTKGRPVFVYVDEAHRFLDETVNDMLTDARKHRMGLVLAHQSLEQIKRSEMMGALRGTAIKFAGGIRAGNEASALANDMKTTPEFIMGLDKYHWALSIDGAPAVSVIPSPDPLRDYYASELFQVPGAVSREGKGSSASRESTLPDEDVSYD